LKAIFSKKLAENVMECDITVIITVTKTCSLRAIATGQAYIKHLPNSDKPNFCGVNRKQTGKEFI